MANKLTGFVEFDKLLAQLPSRVENRILQKAATGALRVVLPDMKRAAPLHVGFQSAASKQYGTLRSNEIVVRSKRDKKKGQRGAYISTGDAFWGFIIEMGSRYMPAHPWFLPKFTELKDRVLQECTRILGAGIEAEARKKQ